jgi:hypothetical protein
MFNAVGGIYANMIIIYCSLSEYIVIWGVSEEAKGKFSGYYPFMKEYDVMMRGTMTSNNVGPHGRLSLVYKPIIQDGIPGNTVDTSHLVPSNVRTYSLERYSYMVSYAQGSMLYAFIPGAIMPGIFASQDFKGMFYHISECVRSYKNAIFHGKFNKHKNDRANYAALDLLK